MKKRKKLYSQLEFCYYLCDYDDVTGKDSLVLSEVTRLTENQLDSSAEGERQTCSASTLPGDLKKR